MNNIIKIMIMSRIAPTMDDNDLQLVINKYSKKKPTINWNNKNSIYKSGWSISHNMKVNICLIDEIKTMNKISFIIEYPYTYNRCKYLELKKMICMKYIFEINESTGLVNMLYRVKKFYEEEHCVLYKDCKYFGLRKDAKYNDNKLIIQHSFIISNDNQDKSLLSYINFDYDFQDFNICINYINDFIQTAIKRYNYCNNIHLQPAYPLLENIMDNLPMNNLETIFYSNQIKETTYNTEAKIGDVYNINGELI